MKEYSETVNNQYDQLLYKGYIVVGMNKLLGTPIRHNILDVLGQTSDLQAQDIHNLLVCVLNGEETVNFKLEEIIKDCLELI